MNVNDIDLNLLKIFEAVYAERSVSRAAERVGLTQPSVSHGLARLRTLFRDPLFVRVKGGVAPTAAAKRIAPALAEALRSVQTVLDDAVGFDPATAKRVFRVHMSDLGEMVFLPPLMRVIRERAPHVAVETRQLDWTELAIALEHGAIDMAIGHLPSLIGAFAHQHLFKEEYVTLRRRGASRASRTPSRTPSTSPSRRIRRRWRSWPRAACSIASSSRSRTSWWYRRSLPKSITR